jgi:hypothetical protein
VYITLFLLKNRLIIVLKIIMLVFANNAKKGALIFVKNGTFNEDTKNLKSVISNNKNQNKDGQCYRFVKYNGETKFGLTDLSIDFFELECF